MADLNDDLDTLLKRREEAERQKVARELLLRRRGISGVRNFIKNVATPVFEEVRDALQRNHYTTEMVVSDEEVTIRFQLTSIPHLLRLHDINTYKVAVRGECAEATLYTGNEEPSEDWSPIIHRNEPDQNYLSSETAGNYVVDLTKEDVLADFKRRFFGVGVA